MSGWRRVSAAMFVAAAFSVCCVSVAAGACPGRRRRRAVPFIFWRRPMARRQLYAWRPAVVARRDRPRGLHAAGHGFRRVLPLPFRRAQRCLGCRHRGGAQLLPRWRFKHDQLEVKVFVGLDIKNDVTSPYDPSKRLHGTSTGVHGPSPASAPPMARAMGMVGGGRQGRRSRQSIEPRLAPRRLVPPMS